MTKTHVRNVVILGIVTSLMIGIYGRIEWPQEQYSDWDLTAYRSIALAAPRVATNISQPYAYRLFGPYVAGLLPLPDDLAFYLLTIVCSYSLVFLFYLFLCDVGLSPQMSLVATVLFVFNKYFFGFPVWNFFQVNDVLAFIFLLLLFWSMFRSKWIMFGLTMFAGAMTKETVLLMVPIVFVYLVEKKSLLAEGRPALIAVLPGIATFLVLRLLIPVSDGKDLLSAFLLSSGKLYAIETWFRLLVNSFVPLSFLPFIFYKRTCTFFRDKKYALFFLLLILLSTFFGNNNERLVAPAFIVVYWLLGEVIETSPLDNIALSIIVFAGFLSSLHYEITAFGLISRNETVVLSMLSLAGVTVVSLYYRVRELKRAKSDWPVRNCPARDFTNDSPRKVCPE